MTGSASYACRQLELRIGTQRAGLLRGVHPQQGVLRGALCAHQGGKAGEVPVQTSATGRGPR